MDRPTEKQLLRYVSGESDLQERIEITEWASANRDNDIELKAARKLYEATFINAPCIEDPALVKARSHKVRRAVAWIAGAAACAASLAIGCLVGNVFGGGDAPVQEQVFCSSISVPVGQRVHTFLSDGTEVWLNSNSRLDFMSGEDGCRRVVLDGEGWFNVARNESMPFVVETPNNTVKVLGTVFNVTSYSVDDSFRVKLYEGKVAVGNSEERQICTLLPNETLEYVDGQYRKGMMDAGSREDWIDGIYYFDNMTYAEILDAVKNYFRVEIVFEDESVADYRCTFRFRQEDGMDHLLDALSLVHRFSWEWTADRSRITIKKN